MRFYNTGKCKFMKTEKGEAMDLAVPGQKPGAAVVFGKVVQAGQFVDVFDDITVEAVLRANPSLVVEAEAPTEPAKIADDKAKK